MRFAFRKKAPTFYSKLIMLFTGNHSHTEAIFTDGLSFSSDEKDGGPRFKVVEYKEGDWDILEFKTTAAQEANCRTIASKILQGNLKKNPKDKPKYDWKSIFLGFLPVPIGVQNPDDWICSETTTVIAQSMGLALGYTPSQVSPHKLYKILVEELKTWENN